VNEGNYVLYEHLKDKICTNNSIWAEALTTRNTITSKILLDSYFHVNSSNGLPIPDAISIQALLSFGLLLCVNTDNAAAKVFYKMLNPHG
jgi:hypothetical protein